jgi:hypothetical protein
MPNHVTNAIEFATQEDFELAKTKLTNEDGYVDFELLVPTPLNVYLGNTSREDDQDFGQFTWYAWNRENWGTKWNAYDTEVEEELRIIRFDTAWSPPYPIIVALSRHVPNFTHYYIEETYESWGKEVWRDGSRVAYWKNDPEMYETIFVIVEGTGAWERCAADYARDAEEYPDEGLTWPPDLSNYTPTVKLPDKFLDEQRGV